jgi:hypothetical protein
MSFQIRCQLPRAEAPDPKELLGEVTLSDGAASFSKDATYVDSWLEAFIQAYRDFERKGRGTAEIVEEPLSITISRAGGGVIVKIGAVGLAVTDASSLRDEIRRAAATLLADAGSDGSETPVLETIREFAQGEPTAADHPR